MAWETGRGERERERSKRGQEKGKDIGGGVGRSCCTLQNSESYNDVLQKKEVTVNNLLITVCATEHLDILVTVCVCVCSTEGCSLSHVPFERLL